VNKITPALALMRLHKPIGILLLLWPTLWALWIAADGFPSYKNLSIFIGGVILMRSAGCVINDFFDRRFDGHVARTKNRPLVTHKILSHQAIILFIVLCAAAFLLVLFTNILTIVLACFALATAMIYPLMKRYTHWPQLILGVAFSLSIPMAFAAQTGKIAPIAWLMMLANIAWTIAYDTQYAMTDRDDDIAASIKSTAILFGRYDRLMIALFQFTMIVLLFFLGVFQSFSLIYFFALLLCILLFIYQHRLIARRTPEKCFLAFLNNQWIGLIVFSAIALSYRV
jgi:4-hydroxybenzoate polyprenyltransferase